MKRDMKKPPQAVPEMPKGIQEWLRAPDLGDSEANNRGSFLMVVILIAIGFTVPLFLLTYIFLGLAPIEIILMSCSILIELAAWVLLQRRHLLSASRLLVLGLWLTLNLYGIMVSGVQSVIILGQLLVILMSGMLLSEPVAIVIGLLTITANYYGLVMQMNEGVSLPTSSLDLASTWAIQSGFILVTIGVTSLFLHNRRDYTAQIQDSRENLVDQVTELARAQNQLEMSQQTLQRREAILETLRSSAERLFREPSIDHAVNQVIADLGRATAVDRVSIFENYEDEQNNLRTRLSFEWVDTRVKPRMGIQALHSFRYQDSHAAAWPSLLGAGQVIRAGDRLRTQAGNEGLLSPDAQATLVAPIFAGNRLWGFISFDENKWDRAWSPAEVDALRGAAGILGGAIERQRTEHELNRSEVRYLGILQDQLDLICRYTPDGGLLFGNHAYLQFLGIDKDHINQTKIWDHIQRDRIAGLKAKIASLTPDDPLAVSQTLSRRSDGEMRWIQWSERGIFDESGELLEVQAVGRDIDAEVRLRKQLEENLIKTESLAMTDDLTGLLNRRAITEHAEAEWQRAIRENRPLSLVIADLDRLKTINDTFGHLIGDQALSFIGEVMRSGMRRYDWAGRWGGDEFLLVLPGTDNREAYVIAERLRQRATEKRVGDGKSMALEISLGVASRDLKAKNDSLQHLLARADQALYMAKQAGRNQVSLAE